MPSVLSNCVFHVKHVSEGWKRGAQEETCCKALTKLQSYTFSTSNMQQFSWIVKLQKVLKWKMKWGTLHITQEITKKKPLPYNTNWELMYVGQTPLPKYYKKLVGMTIRKTNVTDRDVWRWHKFTTHRQIWLYKRNHTNSFSRQEACAVLMERNATERQWKQKYVL